MKKGLETMETRENYLTGRMYLSFGGAEGLKMEPISLVENDLIAQNLLILAYEKPITVSDLSKAIGIPAAYIEPIVKKLVDGELMAETASGKVYADFLITKPQDKLKNFKPQLDFVDRHFDAIWNIVAKMSADISGLAFVSAMDLRQKTELDRYAVLKALQDFQHYGTSKVEAPHFPKRRDGGRWIAQATVFDAGYNTKEYDEASEYAIQGGHCTTENFVDGGARRVRLYKFDTTLWATPTVNTETVQRLFTQAYNRMMENREQIIKDCETMRRALTDFAELDAEIERQLEETQVVAELVKAAVKENASTAQSQEAYLRKYEALTERYEKAAAELERLQNLRTTQSQQDKAMALYIRTLKKQPVVLREWSDTIWTVMVEKAIVHRNGAITFVFKNGTEVKVGE